MKRLLACVLMLLVMSQARAVIPAVSKSFSPSTISVGATSTLTLSIANTNSYALTSVAFTDAFPSGLQVAATPALTNTCGGSISGGTAGSGTLILSGGSIAANASCTITVAVSTTASTTNVYTNTTGGVSADQWTGAGTASNSASLTVIPTMMPPTIAMSYSANPVSVLGTSVLTIAITNPNFTALTGIAFTDTYPAGGMGNVLIPGTSNTCGGTATGASLGSSLSLTGGTLAGGSSCTVSTTVGSGTAGVFNNVTTAVTSSNGGTGTTASGTFIVSGAPYITKSFSPARINTGGTSTLTLTITNVLSLGQANVAFTDTFPSGLVVASTPALTNTCGGNLTGATAGSGSITLANGSIPILSTCNITLAVTSASPGNYANTTGVLSTATGTYSTSNTAVLQVVKSATLTKSFSPSTILTSGTSTMTLAIANPNSIALTGVGFSDTFPTNLVVSSTPTVTSNCSSGVPSAGSSSLSLSGATIPANSTCTITLQVTSTVPGAYPNTTSGVSSNEALTGSASNTATLTVNSIDLQVKKSHAAAFVVGSTGTYTITVNNAGTGPTSGTVTVTDTLPAGLTYVAAGSGGTGWTCGASAQVVTCTSTTAIVAGGSAPAITLNASVAAVAVPSVTNSVTVAGGSEPAAYANNNTASDYTLVANPAQTTFSTSGQQTAAAGTVVFYSHSFLAGYAGNVTFSTADTPTPVISGWSSALFTDTNCNGILDGSEGATLLSGSVAVAAGGQVCIIEKVFIPATAKYGAKDQTVVTAAFTPTSTGSSATLTQTDVTLVGAASGAGLTLQKTVRNVTTGGTASANNTAVSGQTLEYTIIYSNASATSLSTLVVRDSTPRFTVFVSAACVAPLPSSITACNVTTQPSAGAQGSLVWTLTGSLQSGASGSVLFRVTLQ
jgi:mucin-19